MLINVKPPITMLENTGLQNFFYIKRTDCIKKYPCGFYSIRIPLLLLFLMLVLLQVIFQ